MITFRYIVFIICVLCSCTIFANEEWADVTGLYIKNSTYANNNNDSWLGTELNFDGAVSNASHFQKTYDTYQPIFKLPAGRYRLLVQGFYRAGDASKDYSRFNEDGDGWRLATMYAKCADTTFSAKLVHCSSGAVARSFGGSTAKVEGKYLPNDMVAAHKWFEAGYYNNMLEFELTKEENITIGIGKNKFVGGDWTCIANWRLEYWTDNIHVESITFDSPSMFMALGEERQLRPEVKPDNAVNKLIRWQSGNTRVITVSEDGLAKAMSEGSAVLTGIAVDGSGCKVECNVTVRKVAGTRQNIVMNEIMPSNIDMFIDMSYNFGSWIELYNPTDTAVTLAGLYITDDATNLRKYGFTQNHGAVPGKGYKVIWFDHYDEYAPQQVNFKLEYEGGTITISNGNTVLAQFTYPETPARASYARTEDGGAKWRFTAMPTPGASNTTSVFASKQLNPPTVDREGQLFTGALTTHVAIPDGTTLRYTLDGTTPTDVNGMTSESGEFTFSESAMLRLRLYRDGYLPSKVVSHSYILKTRDFVFPIISVITNDDFINSKELGLFQRGPHGAPGRGETTPCNWNRDWDRPVNMEYFTPDGNGQYTLAHNQEVDFSMAGGWSRNWTPHSFKLKADKQYYGENFLSYPFFKDKPFNKNKTLQMRNGGNDTQCRIRDAVIQEVARRGGWYVDGQCWQPTHIILNGKYYATLNMREPSNRHFAYANYGISSDDIDQFDLSPDSGLICMEGNFDALNRWTELSKSATKQSSYDEICELVDIDEYINYLCVELYFGCNDWPQNNCKYFRKKDGKFHFVLFDLDSALSTNDPFGWFAGRKSASYNKYDPITGQRKQVTEEIPHVANFLRMLDNASFRKRFIDAFCVFGGSVATAERFKDVVNDVANIEGLNGFVNPSATAESMLKAVGDSYNGTMTNALKNYSAFKLSQTPKQTLHLSTNIDNAKLSLNGITIPTNTFDGVFFGPATLKAEAPAGYRFAGWLGNGVWKTTPIFTSDSEWKYYTKGSLNSKNWYSTDYSDARWSTGKAPLGYNQNGLNTTIPYGGNPDKKYPTYYFRKVFEINNVPDDADFILNYSVDDGFVVYVNGVEAGRYNMPSGDISYSTYGQLASNNPDVGSLTLDKNLFHIGENLIAVEVHNYSAASTDVVWSAELGLLTPDNDISQYDSTEPEFTLNFDSSITLKAVFKPLAKMDKKTREITPVVINEVSANNEIFINEYFKKGDWIELYNTTDENIDVAGMYVSDNASKPTKYQIPASAGTTNTIIPAHGFLVVWCDQTTKQPNDQTANQLHASFKLDADGGDVLLTASDLSWTNTLNYPPHDGWHSVGRFPDGAENTYMFAMPSINKTNRLIFADNIVYSPTSTKDLCREVETTNLTVPVSQNELNVPFSKLSEIADAIESNDLLTGEHLRGLMDDGYWSNPVAAVNNSLTFNQQGYCSNGADITLRFDDSKIYTRAKVAPDDHWTANALVCFQNAFKRYTIHLTLMSEEEYTAGITTLKPLNPTISSNAYNLAGQRISTSYRGIQIINGRKVIKP
ncbi:MAG: lamin tail domain-containing protein [Bacteroidaceae bacterium]|nr:lamin tail domain-containing protein [Bacteroidaceae bacterium]